MNPLVRNFSGDVDILFKWSGPTEKTFRGNLAKNTIGGIKINGLVHETAVRMFPKLKKGESRFIKFTVENRETYSLKTSLKSLKDIQIIANVYKQKNFINGPSIKEVETLPLRKPAKIEAGAAYTIVCTRKGATLEKCEDFDTNNPLQPILYDTLMLYNDINYSQVGCLARLSEQLQNKIADLHSAYSLQEVEQMIEALKDLAPPEKNADMYLAMVKDVENSCLNREDELFNVLDNLLTEQNYEAAWDLVFKELGKSQEAGYSMLIKRYAEEVDYFDQNFLNEMLDAMPDGEEKSGVLNYIDNLGVQLTKIHDPVYAWGVISQMPEGELKNALAEEIKAAQAQLPQVDVDLTLLFGNTEEQASAASSVSK